MSTTSNSEYNSRIAAQIKGLFGKQAQKLINWLSPCCPFQIDGITAVEAGKFTVADWNGSFLYVTTTGGVFTEVGFYLAQDGAWVKSTYTAPTEVVIPTYTGAAAGALPHVDGTLIIVTSLTGSWPATGVYVSNAGVWVATALY